ncbi:hypothetical protein P343_06265 [Sporolactobacillus laevolacticus DSM 442]|uniref:Uncharacterized protein n=1 Tax=Sporolactobacillus laevolacticus DSM 442 TaxID=1395513 RepID=V6IZA1_9BACL|nr:hypothetical protein P343_06265 [Sporolactobacillus laevolacticus DSM 442]
MVNFTQKINKSHVVLDAELNIIDVAVDGELKHPVSVQK